MMINLTQAFSLLVNILDGDDATDASSIVSPRSPSSPNVRRHSSSLMDDGRGD
jgi:hypothetical protein